MLISLNSAPPLTTPSIPRSSSSFSESCILLIMMVHIYLRWPTSLLADVNRPQIMKQIPAKQNGKSQLPVPSTRTPVTEKKRDGIVLYFVSIWRQNIMVHSKTNIFKMNSLIFQEPFLFHFRRFLFKNCKLNEGVKGQIKA